MVTQITPRKIQIYVNAQKKTMTQVKAETGCTHIINGGIYDISSFVPYCHLKADGTVLAADPYTYWGYAWNAKDLTLTSDYAAYRNYIACVCLAKDGKAEPLVYPADMGGERPRSCIGRMPDGRVVLYCSTTKMTPEMLRAHMLTLGVESAIMMDGGGSTQGDFDGQVVPSQRIVHNFICLWADKPDAGGDPGDIKRRYLAKNEAYIKPEKITPKRIMVHSTATPGATAERIAGLWDKYDSVCAHAIIDENGILQLLPWNYKAFHSGGSANLDTIGFEICEPGGIVYNANGSKIVSYDAKANQAYFDEVWGYAVSLCAQLCETYEIHPDNIISHAEGYQLGVASNHADVGHWFPWHGVTMDDFRKAVRDRLTDPPVTEMTQEQFNAMFGAAMTDWLKNNKFRLEAI